MIAFDAEYTSLDPKQMRLVSFALVPVEEDIVKVREALYVVVKQKEVGPSAKIHGIVGGYGVDEGEALEVLYRNVEGKTLLVYTTIDVNFLKRVFGKRLKNVKYIDVAEMYIRYKSARSWLDVEIQKGLSLERIARELGVEITNFIFHDALLDAIHTALVYIKLKKLGVKPKEKKL